MNNWPFLAGGGLYRYDHLRLSVNILFGEYATQLILQQIIGILPLTEQGNLFPNGKNLRQCRETILTTNDSLYYPTGFLTSRYPYLGSELFLNGRTNDSEH